MHLPRGAQPRDRPVVEAAAVAEPVPAGVEGDSGTSSTSGSAASPSDRHLDPEAPRSVARPRRPEPEARAAAPAPRSPAPPPGSRARAAPASPAAGRSRSGSADSPPPSPRRGAPDRLERVPRRQPRRAGTGAMRSRARRERRPPRRRLVLGWLAHHRGRRAAGPERPWGRAILESLVNQVGAGCDRPGPVTEPAPSRMFTATRIWAPHGKTRTRHPRM